MNVLEFGASKLWNPRPLYSYPRQTLHDTLPEDGWLPQASGGPGPLRYHLGQSWSSSGGRSSPPRDPLGPLPAVRPSLQAKSWAVLCVLVFAYGESTVNVRQWLCWELIRVWRRVNQRLNQVTKTSLVTFFFKEWLCHLPANVTARLKDRTDILAIYTYTAILKWNVY